VARRDQSSPRTERGSLGPHAGLRAALDEDQLLLQYMPVVDLRTGRPQGVEALLRWKHPVGGLLGPDDFLAGIAHLPLMQDITGWVLRTAVAAVAAWPGWTMSVNVTAYDVCRPTFVEQVDEALHNSGVAPHRLTLELTEQALVENLETARGILGALRDRGVGLSLDDFGTGYSSFLYLRQLPITELKIDRAFVSQTPNSPDDLAIVSSIAALGQAVGVAVVAEGVATGDQAVAVRNAGCTAAQGYLWGPPAEAAHLDAALVQQTATEALGLQAPVLRDDTPRPPTESVDGPRVQQLLREGASLHTIAAALNREGSRTPHLTRWSAAAVAAVIAPNLPHPPHPLPGT
jgi:EAL domain-containing protein (putative c-di-GMP-specific phosphodiesterase class I)